MESLLTFSKRKDFLEKNLEVFLKRFPLYSAPIEEMRKGDFASSFEVEEDALGLSLHEQGFCSDSTRADFFPPAHRGSTPARYLLCGGFGLGAYPEFLLTQDFSEVETLLVIEPSMERFLAGLSLRPLENLLNDSRIYFFVGFSPEDLGTELLFLLNDGDRLLKAKAYQFLAHPIIHALHPGYFLQAKVQWETALENAKNTTSYRADGMKGLKHSIENLEWIRNTPGVDRLKNRFLGVPAIIISTGPSLTKALPTLKKMQNRALLISADASLKILLEAGITPHFVLTLEREVDSKPFFENLKWPSTERSHLLSFPVVPPSVIEAHEGPQWVAYRSYEYYGFFENQYLRNFIQCGPSVAHMALSFANHMNCSQAILVGQDLAYDPDKFSSHASGISYGDWSADSSFAALVKLCKERGEEVFWVPGNIREKVPTSTYYWVFLQIFVDHHRRLRIPLTNSTEGGARIPGVKWQSFEETTRDFSNYQVEGLDLFGKLRALRSGFKAGSSFDWNLINESAAYLEREIQSSSQILKSLLSAANESAPDISKRMLLRLREDQQKLLHEDVFRALVSHFSGVNLIELEWSFHLLFDDDPQVDLKRLNILEKFYEEMDSVLKEVQSYLQPHLEWHPQSGKEASSQS